jgi:hypothetical protein
MKSNKTTPRLLGAAFLIQAVASAISYLLLRDPLIVSGNIIQSMNNIANNAFQMRASIVFEMITVIGVIMLGALLYLTLEKQNKKIALVAMGLYLIEVALLAVSSLEANSLLIISKESVLAGHPIYLQTLGNLHYLAMDFANALHMLPFALGATMFYFLIFKSGFIPKALSLFGLCAAIISLAATFLVLLGVEVPLIIYLPNLPFELTIGVWLVVNGIKEGMETTSTQGAN